MAAGLLREELVKRSASLLQNCGSLGDVIGSYGLYGWLYPVLVE